MIKKHQLSVIHILVIRPLVYWVIKVSILWNICVFFKTKKKNDVINSLRHNKAYDTPMFLWWKNEVPTQIKFGELSFVGCYFLMPDWKIPRIIKTGCFWHSTKQRSKWNLVQLLLDNFIFKIFSTSFQHRRLDITCIDFLFT